MSLVSFLYPDVPEFLRMTGNEAIILTYGTVLFQKVKVDSALYGIPRISVYYIGETQKWQFFSKHIKNYTEKKLFVDDKPSVLEKVSAHYPDIDTYEIRRDGKVGDGRWKVINSLNKLP